jgi:hypothetical protein
MKKSEKKPLLKSTNKAFNYLMMNELQTNFMKFAKIYTSNYLCNR